ncbi:MAG: hypothetical protein LBH25_08275, partial [Fibromonadaceae bacterium]|nr:hypothetical protein [Fibromonadaceae bacterium]
IASCYATKTVKANDIIKKLEKGESIEIADAVVEGVLDFSSVGKSSPVNSAMQPRRPAVPTLLFTPAHWLPANDRFRLLVGKRFYSGNLSRA